MSFQPFDWDTMSTASAAGVEASTIALWKLKETLDRPAFTSSA
jgi:hypothetical protein